MSGLIERTDVSQYRLAAHLGLAIFLLALSFWYALELGHMRRCQAGYAANINAPKISNNVITRKHVSPVSIDAIKGKVRYLWVNNQPGISRTLLYLNGGG